MKLRRRLRELGLKPFKFIRGALEREVEGRLKLQLYEKMDRASKVILRIGKDAWIRAIKESREER